MSETLILFGANGHGKVAMDAAVASGRSVASLVDDHPRFEDILGCRVICANDPEWGMLCRFDFLVSIGDNRTRERIFYQLCKKGGSPTSVIHPTATVASSARLGAGTFVGAGAVINPAANIGENGIVNTCASVDHDCRLGKHVHICPGVRLAGDVNIGSGTLVGIGAVVLPGVSIGDWCVIGAGSVVTRSLPSEVVAFGNPARVKRSIAG